MKEATGEASMTGITIAVIAVIAAIAVPLIRSMMTTTAKKACCAGYGGIFENNACKVGGKDISNWWDSTKNECK